MSIVSISVVKSYALRTGGAASLLLPLVEDIVHRLENCLFGFFILLLRHPGPLALTLCLKGVGLPDPEPGAADGLQNDPMLEVVEAVQQPVYFFPGQHGRQLPDQGPRRQAEAVVDFPAADMALEKGDTGEIGLA